MKHNYIFYRFELNHCTSPNSGVSLLN